MPNEGRFIPTREFIMFNPVKFLDQLIHFDPQQRMDEAYLAQASDISDLERRMLELETHVHHGISADYAPSDAFGAHMRPRW